MRFPNEKAHGKQVKEMCNAFATCADVTLLVPTRKSEGDVREFGLARSVRFKRIPVPDLIRFGKIGFHITELFFTIGTAVYMLFRRRGLLVYTREYVCALAPSLLGIPTAWESHRGEWNWLVRLILKTGAKIVVISKGLRDFYLSHKVPKELLLIAPDGVDLARYQDLPTKEDARKQLRLPREMLIALYNGHLHTWKGAGTLAQAASLLPTGSKVIFMGGTDEDIEVFKKQYGGDVRIDIIGRKGDSERPIYLRAADALVLPNTAKDEISVNYTSPLKLFGYMAAGTPIVASDLPSIREVVSEDEVFFATPDDPASFAESIKKISQNSLDAANKAVRARKLVDQYEWTNRAKAIVTFLADRI